MQPLRIEWTFTSPVVVNSNYLQHLDALVAFAVCDEARELGASNAVELSQELGHVFAQLRSPGGDVWKASALLYTPSTEIFTANRGWSVARLMVSVALPRTMRSISAWALASAA